jgi:predicted ATPase/DNA-binding CsgD family transcriptional regulator
MATMGVNSRSRLRLPVRLSPFVGRQDDLQNVSELVQSPSIRLVTILGPGGVGKTRLAIELARSIQDRFKHGAIFIPLAQLSTMEELLPALAGALQMELPPGGDLQQLLQEHMAGQEMLFVLDNFEQLLGESALISEILENCSQVKILITSREKLSLEAETLYHLGGLGLPPENTLENIREYGAVSLFLQKAGQVCPGFSLTANNTSAIIQICQLVDGNALGILLAAAWLEYFSPEEVITQICHSLDFLSHELRDVEPRHHGMRAVFDSSFNRLDEHLQAVFRRLAMFRGGFDLPAARAIAGADLRTLIALVDKSLLTREPHTGRYELHELLRQYAAERLEASGEQQTILAAYTEYYITFVCQREGQLISPVQRKALDEIQTDFDNIRQAFSYALRNRNFAPAWSAFSGLYAFCDMRSRFYEAEAIFRLACECLAPVTGKPPHFAWSLALLSWYDMHVYIEPFESFEEITVQAQTSMEWARAINDQRALAASNVLLGAIMEDQGDFQTAIGHYKMGMQLYPLLDDAYFTTIRLALCYQALQQYPEAIQAFHVCLKRGQETGEHVKIAWSLFNIGETLLMQQKPEQALPYLQQASALFTEVGTALGILCCKYCLGRAALALGDTANAWELAKSAAEIAQQIHSPTWTAKTDRLLQQFDSQHSPTTIHISEPGDETFSPRELEVLQLLKSDLTGPAIAEQLVVSLNTVRYHTKNIYRKLGASTRLEAIQRAKEIGL